MATSEELLAAIARFIITEAKQYNIVQGPVGTTVPTDAGSVPSYLEHQAQLELVFTNALALKELEWDNSAILANVKNLVNSAKSSNVNSFQSGSMTKNEELLSVKFIFVKDSIPNMTVGVGGGATHYKAMRWDGVWTAPKSAPNPTAMFPAEFGAAMVSPYNSKIPKFIAVCPCNSSGTATGHLNYFRATANEITTFDANNISTLEDIDLGNNYLTSFDGSGLTSLTSLELDSNNLKSFNGQDMGALTFLNLETNLLSNFNGYGLVNLSVLKLSQNPLTSFSGYGLTNLDELVLEQNDIINFDGVGMPNVTKLTLTQNPIASFSANGMNSLNQIYIKINPNLSSIDMAGAVLTYGYSSYYGSQIRSNNLDAAGLDAFYTSLGEDLSTSGIIEVGNNPGTASDDPTIATAKGYTIVGT